MIYLQLFLSFFQIGLFSFGGGYAMIPLIQHELERHGWMTSSQFVDIIAISQMTPGPLSVNAATFVGYKMAGTMGGMVATLGVALPSMLLILSLSGFFFRYREHALQKSLFRCIRPAIAGLIADAAVAVLGTSLFAIPADSNWLGMFLQDIAHAFDIRAILLFVLCLALLAFAKMNPILLIGLSAILGILVYGLLPLLFPSLNMTSLTIFDPVHEGVFSRLIATPFLLSFS